MILTIAGRELRSLFLSPLAWSILAVVELILGFMFLSQIDAYLMAQPQLAMMESAPGITDFIIAPLFGNAAVVLLLALPLVTMRLISEERRNQTISLLMSAPLSMTEIALGKYLGILGFVLIMLGMIVLMPLSLLLGGSLDLGMLASGTLGLALLLASFAAIGLFMSTLTAHPAVAAIATFGTLLLLWILDLSASGGGQEDNVLRYLSLLRHFEPMLRGGFDSTDFVYFLLIIATFLILSIRRLDAYRLQH
ncbi:MAG: ABC transporter permease [Gammaproteobacteria bacterium RBG_16_57_12]|nr:MAG: ABC transporter permease [Gammaproteobacteria bacterium RBG_16_57_12]